MNKPDNQRRGYTPFAPWESVYPDGNEKRYIRKGNSLMLHAAMLDLSHPAYRVLDYMKLESGGKPEFEFPHSKFRKIISKDGFQRAVRELVDAGFIEVLERNARRNKPNVYRFCSAWKDRTWSTSDRKEVEA